MISDNLKTVVITGSTGGIGVSLVDKFYKMGWNIVALGRRDNGLKYSNSSRYNFIFCDLEDINSVSDACINILKVSESIDVLMLNAGAVEMASIKYSSQHLIDKLYKINFCSHFHIIRMLEDSIRLRDGCVVATSSMSAHDPFPDIMIYGAMKAALEAVIRGISNSGIKAYSLAPGAVETPMLRSLFNESEVPKSKALAPSDVATKLVSLALGEASQPSGSSILMPSP